MPDPAPMVRATLHMQVRAGGEQAFEAAWRQVAERVAGDPANLRQTLLRDPAASGRYTVTTDWVDADAFRRFEGSARQDALTARLRELRESVEMHLDEIVVHLDGAAKEGGG